MTVESEGRQDGDNKSVWFTEHMAAMQVWKVWKVWKVWEVEGGLAGREKARMAVKRLLLFR